MKTHERTCGQVLTSTGWRSIRCLVAFAGLPLFVLVSACSLVSPHEDLARPGPTSPHIASLDVLSLEYLRTRDYTANFMPELKLGDERNISEYSKRFGKPYYSTYVMSYRSDGLRVYSRVDLPPSGVVMPSKGFPVIIFSHGWVGEAAAPGYDFDYTAGAYYGDLLDRYVKAGYVVVTPGFRGHGAVKGVPAEGIEYVAAYDNGSYLSPVFYAIDLLHALYATGTLNAVAWESFGGPRIRVDTDRIYLTGHSQGGDAAFTALAVAGSPALRHHFAAGSIWCGSIAGRIAQGAYFGPMEASPDAVADPAYFPHMPDWWDAHQYTGSIQSGIDDRRQQMYRTIKAYVVDQAALSMDSNRLATPMSRIDAFEHPEYFKVPVDLHYSDMDYFSIPQWNEAAIRNIRASGGQGNAYRYSGNSHALLVVPGWSPAEATPGRETALERTIGRFR